LLCFLACAVDAVSYLRLGHVLTANMTGNTVLLGLALSQTNLRAMMRSGCALVGFLIRLCGGSATRGRFEDAFQDHLARRRLDGKPRIAHHFAVCDNCPLSTPQDR